MQIKDAKEIKKGDELKAGDMVSKVVSVSGNGFVKNDRGEECSILQLQMFLDKNVIQVVRQ